MKGRRDGDRVRVIFLMRNKDFLAVRVRSGGSPINKVKLGDKEGGNRSDSQVE